MKKYKLIKEYPGSPNLGYITKFDNNDEDWNSPNMLILDDCSNYPEFWKEVVEGDYEILKVIAKYSSPSYSPGDFIDYDKMIDYDQIYSVKRLSDGEVFTVGDMIDYPSIPNTKIELLTLANNKIVVWGKFISHMNGFVLLDGITKSRLPLFTTEDGVGVYENDVAWYVDLSESPIEAVKTSIRSYHKYTNREDGIYLYLFSTEELANQFIEENKPQYSKKDMLNFCGYARGMAPWKNSISCYNDWLNSPYSTKK